MATKTRRLADLLANIDDNSKVTSAGLLDATITATDLADDSVGAAEIIDDAVTNAAIADGAIDTAAKLGSNVVTSAKILDANVTAAKMAASAIPVKPHIQPGTLYPAVNGMVNYDSQYTFTDSSGTPKTITSVGNAHHIGNPKIGSTSIRLDANDYFTVPAHADFNFGTSDFCVEWWWKGNFGANGVFWSFGTGGTSWYCYQESATKIRLTMGSAGTRQFDTDSSTVWQGDGQWHHFAVTKSGTTCKLYIDGVEETTINGSFTATPPADVDLSSFIMGIGALHTGVQPLLVDANFDEIRISNHIRYSANFTPSTTAFSNDANTKFLFHSDNGGNSGAYGTAQSDSKKYYYTDIKGSKPIKDPRIGSHFGSQRHKFKSLQLLEQETATHGEDVKSIDGREWIRTIGDYTLQYNTNGSQLYSSSTSTPSIEITGYFSSLNLLGITLTSNSGCVLTIDGVAGSEINPFLTSTTSPLGSRYVDRGSVANIVTGQTLGIHTVKITDHANADENYHYGIELIAQDTSNRNNIQIPSQNVVSYGKKFTVSGTPHYDPFAFKTDGTTAWASGAHNGTSWPVGTGASANIDTATSLGLDNWKHSNNYYKPYNGGRVVKWIASDGTIKTSVNVMPPNAQNVSSSSVAVKANASAANDTYLPTFSGAIDHSLAEVAKTFNWREFGNGSANGNATYADASTLNTTGNIAYVMDDGLTSVSASSATDGANDAGLSAGSSAMKMYLTFIGTGFSQHHQGSGTWNKIAQNLPYGTHIIEAGWTDQGKKVKVDGVEVMSNNAQAIENYEFSFHQPKMPPIPEDAVVIADYMLMADFVAQTVGTVGHISKGVRSLSPSRDYFHDASGVSISLTIDANIPHGFKYSSSSLASGQTATSKLPYFGTDFLIQHYNNRVGTLTEDLNSDVGTEARIGGTTNTYAGLSKHTGNNLAVNRIKNHITDGLNDDEMWTSMTQIASPIHTSSHYQSFETPFLHELVGGDRNMEQNNLVVTSDGKSWDEVTRKTDYLGNMVFKAGKLVSNQTNQNPIILDRFRGNFNTVEQCYIKDFAIAYDRYICLKDGQYSILYWMYIDSGTGTGDNKIKLNGSGLINNYSIGFNTNSLTLVSDVFLKRGDYIQFQGSGVNNMAGWEIKKAQK